MNPTTPPDRKPSESSARAAQASSTTTPAQRIYLEFAESVEGLVEGELAAEFERLCERHPEHAGELRRLRALEAGVERLLEGGPGFFRPEDGGSGEPRRAEGLARSFARGETIGDFELVRFLGHGGMGQVWEARQRSMRRSVALKFLLPGRSDARMLALFEREARAGGRASHPNLVRTLARGESDGIEWIAQELVEGSYSLRDAIERFRREPAPPKDYYTRCATLAQGIAQGLQAAHEAGVVHRDLKPQNILIDARDTPRVADFGLARVEGDTVLSKSGDIAGTYHYMSPEQVAGARSQVDVRTDIFSLGVVLYELLTLQRPFNGDTTQQVTAQVTSFDPPEPSVLRAQCPRDLSVITLKAMQKRPAARYATMKELADDLGRFLRHEPIHARPASRLESARKWVQRNPAPSVGMGVGAAALAVISGVALYAVHQAEQRAEEAQRAERGEAAAKQNLELAERNGEEAQRNAAAAQSARDEAIATANDVLSLSAQKDCDELVAEATGLWPATTAMVPRYETWLGKARELVDGRPEDAARGIKKRLGLADHRARLAALRRDALPQSESEVRADRESHPRFAEWEKKSAELAWRKRMLGDEAWPEAPSVEAELAREQLPTDAEALNAIAWQLVDPQQPVQGKEVHALLLARRALAAGDSEQRAGIRDTHAWALYRNGKLDDALAEMRAALAEPGGEALKLSSRELEKAVKQWQGDALSKRREQLATLAADVVSLAHEVSLRRTFLYADPEKTWWDLQLQRLVESIERIADPAAGLMNDVVAEPFGWGVAKRLAFAHAVRERTLTSPEAQLRWSGATDAIARSERYRGTVFPSGGKLVPQEGLLPLGVDPQSGLWEFWHVQSGDEPERGADGELVRQESGAHTLVESAQKGTGIVLVLLPGGTFWMGAQALDPTAQNFDASADADETPVHRVTLSPFFLSKYEFTQGQWARFTGRNPAHYQTGFQGTLGPTNPVEQVDWWTSDRVTRELGLELPTEAQWEFACRGGTDSVWWTGNAKESLAQRANLADQTYVSFGGWAEIAAWWPEFKDGYAIHAPAGRTRPNAFGLHDMCGNVWEWCWDKYADYPAADVRDPRMAPDGITDRVNRGGAYFQAGSEGRSANRGASAPDYRNDPVGLRAARSIEP